MGIIIRQGFKGTLGTYIGFMLGYVNLLLIYPYFLTSGEIGLMRVFVDLGILLGSLAMLGANSSIYRFSPVFRTRDPEKLSGLFSMFLLKVLLGTFLVCILFYFNKELFIDLFGAKMPEILPLFIWVIPMIGLNALINLLENAAAIRGRIAIPVFVREVFIRLSYALLVFLYALNIINFNILLQCIPLILLIQVLTLVMYCRHLKISFSFKFMFFLQDTALRKEFIKYSIYLIVSVLAGVFISKIDFFMLSSMKGASLTGVYTIAYYIGIVVSIPKRNLKQISDPIVADLTRNNDQQALLTLYKDASINMIVLSMLLFQGIWFNIDSLFEIMPHGELYKEGKWIVFIIGSAYIVFVASGVGGTIISYSKYYFYSLWYSVLAIIVAIMSNLLLIPAFGMVGAAIGTFITHMVLTSVVVIINFWKTKLFPFDKRSIYALLVFTCLILINSFFTINTYIIVLNALKSIAFILIFIYVAYQLKFSNQLNAILVSVLGRIGVNIGDKN